MHIGEMDVTSSSSVAERVNQIQQEAGQIDILICNAGILISHFSDLH